MYVCVYVCMYVRMGVCMYVFMYVCMYVCIYVCMYAYIYTEGVLMGGGVVKLVETRLFPFTNNANQKPASSDPRRLSSLSSVPLHGSELV